MATVSTTHAPKRLVSVADAAAYCACHPRTLRRRISSGDLTGYRMGRRIIRVDLNEVDALLNPIPTAR